MATPVMAFANLANECEKEGMTTRNGDRIAAELSKAFNVHADEVAILRVESGNLLFCFPDKLQHIGSIPVNTTNSVAARTATTKRAEVINNFAQHKHASVFEAVDLENKPKQVAMPGQQHPPQHVIQKLMSVPVVSATGVVGVIQVSRKGTSAPASGPDFSPADLQKLVSIAATLAKCFK